MGTRGIYGFRLNNTDKLTYNHYDSYPSSLGEDIYQFIKVAIVLEVFNKVIKISRAVILTC